MLKSFISPSHDLSDVYFTHNISNPQMSLTFQDNEDWLYFYFHAFGPGVPNCQNWNWKLKEIHMSGHLTGKLKA